MAEEEILSIEHSSSPNLSQITSPTQCPLCCETVAPEDLLNHLFACAIICFHKSGKNPWQEMDKIYAFPAPKNLKTYRRLRIAGFGFPVDVFNNVFEYLTYPQVSSFQGVSKAMQTVVKESLKKKLAEPLVDVASKKPTAHSGTFPEHATIHDNVGTSDKAVDGLEHTRWSGSPTEAWITVDLQNHYAIRAMDIKFEGAYSARFHVKISNDGKKWKQVRELQGTEGWTYYAMNNTGHEAAMDKETQEVLLSKQEDQPLIAGRYIKLKNKQGRLPGWAMSIYHLKVYGV